MIFAITSLKPVFNPITSSQGGPAVQINFPSHQKSELVFQASLVAGDNLGLHSVR
jgi:hypothetical protein